MSGATDRVDSTTALRALACLALVAAPHILNVKAWAIGLLAALIIWRSLCLLRHWHLPPTWLRLTLVFVAFAGVMASYGRINGQTAGVALLITMVGMKLTESRSRRDWEVVLCLTYFLLITHFLFSQSMFMMAFLFIASLAVTTVLVDLSHRQQAMPTTRVLRTGGKLMLHALPVMVLLFVLFPRIPGPLWGLPSDAGAARSGLADEMSPGSIGNLILSEEVAFRVRFDSQPPAKNDLYWRAHVFYRFDGRTWSDGMPDGHRRHPIERSEDRVSYEVTLEPHRQPWLFALDVPVSGPHDAKFSPSHQMWAEEPVKERRLYRVTSVLTDVIDEPLSRPMMWKTRRLPEGAAPRAVELAGSWRDRGLNAGEIIAESLHMFREQPFRYTLQPPPLGVQPVDQFLFETRAGFCEHYASAFVVLMRAAGLPARVVTGYQGGEMNAISDYMIVRQSDAHAWAEVYIEERGWVRVDPTGAVAPERVELGLEAALPAGEVSLTSKTASDLWNFVEMNWDMANAYWNRWVLAYGPELQQSFLSRFGLINWYRMTLALTACIVIALTVLGIFLIRAARPKSSPDPVLRAWQQACARLAKAGLPRLAHEGPEDYLSRIREADPELARQLEPIAHSYIQLRYGRDATQPDPKAIRQLRQAVSALKA